jgi:hypothetical protein
MCVKAGKVGIGTESPGEYLAVSTTNIGNQDLLSLNAEWQGEHLGPALEFLRGGSVLSRVRGIEEGNFKGGLVFEVQPTYYGPASGGPGSDIATVEAMKIDETGNLYVAGKIYGWNVPSSVITTTQTHNGAFGAPFYNGYASMNIWIQSNGCPGYHVCDNVELTRWTQIGNAVNAVCWYNSGVSNSQTSDCGGYVYGTNAYRGSEWVGGPGSYGPSTTTCDTTLVVCCCK